ncbi:MAG TPA: GMC family oxidoreductase [Nocardioidaceae bacterium]|nr:GMC family oxidoreductase [Nocardioidaceae bacterium]
MSEHDYDWVVIGSGFGGSVSALRLAEKGYKVAVIESGPRIEDKDFPTSSMNLRRFYYMPFVGLRGFFRLNLFRDIFIVSGAGVGGGSLVYANTLYRARPSFYSDPQWRDLGDWEKELAPFYDVTEQMLGVTTYDHDGPGEVLLRDYAEAIGRGHTYKKAPVGVFLGTPGMTVPDPYFGGDGPDRTGCISCGSCGLGCRHGAKNTLVKNYLYLAEKRGVEVLPQRTVTDVRPVGAADGSDGYEIRTARAGGIVRRSPRTIRAKGVVFAAGALGTNRLLQRCKLAGSLPKVSDRLGYLVRTNSESIVAISGLDDSVDYSNSLTITRSMDPDDSTHIELCSYGKGSDNQATQFGLLTPRGGRRTRPFFFAANVLRHPGKMWRLLRIRGWSQRTVLLLVMQSLDTAIRLKPQLRLPNGCVVMTTEQDPDKPNADLVPQAYEAAEWFAQAMPGVAQAAMPEAVLSIPTTAHLLGGAVIGDSRATGVIDTEHRVFGYRNLLVCDGSAVPANVGANPSLTIATLTERAMSKIPAKAVEGLEGAVA